MKRLASLALAACSLFALTSPVAKAAVVAGDIAIIGFSSDAPDGFSFVVINEIGTGETISFWDSGFIGGGDGTGQGALGGDWRGTEQAFVWSNDTGAAVVAGTVIVVSTPDGGLTTADLGGSSGSMDGISGSGDQIFAGQGTAPDSDPDIFDGTLLYAIDFEGDDGWDATTDTSNDSALPSALASFNVTFGEIDNGQYTGTRDVTSASQIAALVSDPANWTVQNSSAFTLDSTDFTITAVPEPSSIALLGVMGLCVVENKRRRDRRRRLATATDQD